MNDVIKAGKIAASALEYTKSIIKIEGDMQETIDKIEEKIFSLGGNLAFPVQISLNKVAAHFLPIEEIKFKKEDVIKVDIGVQINGYIGDTATTIIFDKKNENLIKSSEEALNEAIKLAKPGTKVCEIGKVIEETIKKYGFNSIKNLSGHSIEQYNLHSGTTIPNFDNKDGTILEEGQVIAIEPFATTGIGIVIEGKPSTIYKLINKKPVRDKNTKIILEFIEENYKTLPFSKRWLVKKFNLLKTNLALNTLERENIIYHYPQLTEKSSGIVSQAEHTVLVQKNPIVLTKQ